jgi:hypothetical protein
MAVKWWYQSAWPTTGGGTIQTGAWYHHFIATKEWHLVPWKISGKLLKVVPPLAGQIATF